MLYGKGAGKLPTASAVVSDVIDAVKNAGRHVPIIWEDEELEMGTFADSESRFFVRTDEKDEAAIKALFVRLCHLHDLFQHRKQCLGMCLLVVGCIFSYQIIVLDYGNARHKS